MTDNSLPIDDEQQTALPSPREQAGADRERFPLRNARSAEGPDTGQFPGSSAPTLGTDATGTGSPVSLPPGYEVLGELGRGGMGVVYKARQLKLNRLVALKMILAGGHAAPEDRLRFLAEAETVAGLQHPGIVSLLEFGEHQGLPYFTLELVPGGSLARRLGGVPQPPRDAARLVEQLARCIHYAHAQGIVHRDLKPANILLAEDGSPKIADFGLARRVEVEDAALTPTGAVLGTPSYMAPEQAGGETRHAGPAADVYALGATLYECLTGRPPFLAATPVKTILQVVGRDPVPVRQLQPQTPMDLGTICHKCLEKDQRRRYSTAAALAEDLQCFLVGEPITARPAGQLEKAWKWARRNPATARLYAVLLAACLGLVGLGFWFSASLGAARSEMLAERAAEQRLKEVQMVREVEEDLQTVALLEGKEKWADARTVLERALTRLREGGPPELIERSREIDSRLREERKDREMIASLEEAKLLSLPDLLSGKTKPAGAAEMVELVEICAWTDRPATAARFFEEAFAGKTESFPGRIYGVGARAAILAAQGQGKDCVDLGDPERARLRQQAVEWLARGVTVNRGTLEKGSPEQVAAAKKRLEGWQYHVGFAHMRDKELLSRLPDAERVKWEALWKDIGSLLARYQAVKSEF